MADKIRCHNRSEVTVRNSDLTLSKTPIWVERDDFYGGADRRRKASEPFMVIGFDTEYKTPEQPLSNDQIRAGLAKNQILSYQVYCKLYDPAAGDAVQPVGAGTWGICFLIMRSMALRYLISLESTKETAEPAAPARPVRPMRCT